MNQTEQMREALQRISHWLDSQADAQSKGGHATFDLMALRECRDIAKQALAAPAEQVEPVAWVRRHPDGALTNQFLEDAVIEPARKKSGAWVPLYTHPAPAVAQGEPRFPFAGFDPNFCPGSNPENPQEAPAVAVKLTDLQIEAGAKKLSELFNYPWRLVSDRGKDEMRRHVQTLFETIAAAEAAKKGGAHENTSET